MRTLTTLSLVAMLSLGTASRAMCATHSGADLRQSGWASFTEVWHPLPQVGTGILPGHQSQVLADNEDSQRGNGQGPGGNAQDQPANGQGGNGGDQAAAGQGSGGDGKDQGGDGKDQGGDQDHNQDQHRHPCSGSQ